MSAAADERISTWSERIFESAVDTFKIFSNEILSSLNYCTRGLGSSLRASTLG